MRFLVLGSPYKTNGNQINGRTLRGKLVKTRAVYDIVDVRTPLKRQFAFRKEDYVERGYKIEVLKIE